METSQDWIANIAILNAKLRKESWYNTFWAKWSGNVDISTDDNGNQQYRPSGKPIEILNAYIQQGRDNLLIPFIRDLDGDMIFGDAVLKGTGEDPGLRYLRTYINQKRHAVMKRSGKMSEQRQKLYKLYEEAMPGLSKYFSKWENQSVFETFYEGISYNLSQGTNDEGLGVIRRYHPNWYINDGAALTAIGTEKYFKSNSELDTALGMYVADNASCDTGMTAAILWDLRVKCMELMIPQIVTKNGLKFWALLVHPMQYSALMQETNFRAAQRTAFTGKALDSPELSGALAYYSQFVIYEDIVGIREWDELNAEFMGTTTTERFAPTAVSLNTGTARVYNALVFGNQAIGKGVASDLEFTKEIDDHENTIEIGGALMNGYNRADFVTETYAAESALTKAFYKGAATRTDEVDNTIKAINQSSLIFATREG